MGPKGVPVPGPKGKQGPPGTVLEEHIGSVGEPGVDGNTGAEGEKVSVLGY